MEAVEKFYDYSFSTMNNFYFKEHQRGTECQYCKVVRPERCLKSRVPFMNSKNHIVVLPIYLRSWVLCSCWSDFCRIMLKFKEILSWLFLIQYLGNHVEFTTRRRSVSTPARRRNPSSFQRKEITGSPLKPFYFFLFLVRTLPEFSLSFLNLLDSQ